MESRSRMRNISKRIQIDKSMFSGCRAGAQPPGPDGSPGSGQGVQAGGKFNEAPWGIFSLMMLNE